MNLILTWLGLAKRVLAILGWFIVANCISAAGYDEPSSQRFWFGVGPAVRGGMRIRVEGSSYVQALGLHDPTANGPLTFPSGIGATNGYADRLYDNGYVKLDRGTGDPSAPNPSGTWNWGFSDPGQYNANAQILKFQKASQPGY